MADEHPAAADPSEEAVVEEDDDAEEEELLKAAGWLDVVFRECENLEPLTDELKQTLQTGLTNKFSRTPSWGSRPHQALEKRRHEIHARGIFLRIAKRVEWRRRRMGKRQRSNPRHSVG